MAQTVQADTSEATCRFYKNGDKDSKRSGPCTFSQRQGNISIELKGGNTIKLSPRNQADQFKDQDGKKVVRSGTYGNTQVFKWDDKDKKLIVKFDGTSGGGGHHGGSHGGVQDLVGMRASSGEHELENRGYRFKNSSKDSDRIWANWWNSSERKCITVVTKDGKYDSITDTLPADCDKGGSSGNTHSGDYKDLVGARASSAERGLEDLGFRNVDGFKQGTTAYTIWYNRGSRECLQMATAEGRADSIVDIQKHKKCH
jgi:hypothetical protein